MPRGDVDHNLTNLPYMQPDVVDIGPLDEALNEGAVGRACDDPEKFFSRNLAIGEVLPEAGLAHVVPFNGIYSHMTYRVLEYLHEDRFEMPDWVRKNMPSFGEEYHDDLRLYVEWVQTGDPAVIGRMNPAWAQAMFDSRMRSPTTQTSLQVLVGVNAHIESEDLASSMAGLDTPDGYHRDYKLIDDAISEVIETRLPEYLPMNGNAARLSARSLNGWIVNRRAYAWAHSREIRRLLHEEKDPRVLKNRMNARTVRHNTAVLLGSRTIGRAFHRLAVNHPKALSL